MTENVFNMFSSWKWKVSNDIHNIDFAYKDAGGGGKECDDPMAVYFLTYDSSSENIYWTIDEQH